jgi:hypothetical protein
MNVIGVLLTITGFIVGVSGGLMLSDSAKMVKEDGKVNKERETKIAVLIAICAIMIVGGCLIFVRHYR